MSTKHSVTGLTEDAKEMNELLVHGYIRMDTYSESIPLMLQNLCLKFFQLEYQILKFSARYKSNQGLKLTDNNQCVKRIWTGYKSSKWIICDIKPIYKGIHCWRIHVCH